jgi:hypothetical protein
MKTLFLVASAAVLLQDPPPPPPSGPAGGKIEWGKDFLTGDKRARLEQRALLLYFTDGGLPCKALDDGPFSADEVVAAARRLLPVMLECFNDGAHSDLRVRFKITAFPTLIILEPDGKTSIEITARDAAGVGEELKKAGRRFPGRDVMWVSSMEAAIEKAKDSPRPLAAYLHAPEEDLAAAQDRIVKLAGQNRADKFIWIELAATMEAKDPMKVKYEFYSLPAIAFIDPRFPEPKWMTTYELPASAKSKSVQEQLEKMLKKYKDTKIKK